MDKNHIYDLSNAEFVSFLFSERARETNISEFHGWNNWALAGAIVSVILAGYSVLKNNPSLVTLNVVYNVSCLLAFFLAYHSWSRMFRRARGVDFSKVRMLKEVLPIVKIVFIFICAIFLAILISVIDGFNSVFLLWVFIIIAYTVAIFIAIAHKEKVVPSFFKEMVFPWIWINIGFEAFIGGLLALIVAQSFKLAGRSLFSPEFEFATCVSAVFVLLFILFKLNFGNRVVRRFDEIIDMYLYAGKSKEETLHEILKNRMGYGVLDGCYKELKAVERKTEICVAEEKELDEIKDAAVIGGNTIGQLKKKQARVDIIIKDLQDTLHSTTALVDRMDEIVKVSSYFRENSEIKHVFDTNSQCLEKVKAVVVKARDVSRLLHNTEMQILEELKVSLEHVQRELMEEEN